jgi:acetyl-CoA carboxylase biotin carboxyl carrier protein
MEMDQKLIRELLDAFDRSDWQEMAVSIGTDQLFVSRRAGSDGRSAGGEPAPARGSPAVEAVPAAPAADPDPAPAPAQASDGHPASARAAPGHAEEAPSSTDAHAGTVIESPSVGLFWRAPSPGAPPFVDVGAHVTAGDTLAIVEVMKLMNHIVTPVDGTVTAILPANGDTVQYGQQLVVVDGGA